MDGTLAVALLAPGLALGSFLNVVAARVPLRRSVVRPRSACMSCGAEIAWYDNVPLLSYALLRGRCRSCSAPISWRYPAVEVATALLLVGCVWKFGFSVEAAVATLFCATLVTVSAIDLEHGVVPRRLVLPVAAVVLVAQTVLHPSAEWVLAALAGAAFLLAAALVYPRGMGMGDVLLAFLLGAMLGRTVSVALMVGILAALVPALVLFVRYRSRALKLRIPFAPFLALGGVVALFAGHEILDAYLALT